MMIYLFAQMVIWVQDVKNYLFHSYPSVLCCVCVAFLRIIRITYSLPTLLLYVHCIQLIETDIQAHQAQIDDIMAQVRTFREAGHFQIDQIEDRGRELVAKSVMCVLYMYNICAYVCVVCVYMCVYCWANMPIQWGFSSVWSCGEGSLVFWKWWKCCMYMCKYALQQELELHSSHSYI